MQLLKLMLSFCKSDTVNTMMAETSSGVKPTLYLESDNQLPDKALSIDQDIRTYIGSQGKLDLKTFYADVRNLFSSVVDDMLLKFPFGDVLLQHAVVANIANRQTAKFSSLNLFHGTDQAWREIGPMRRGGPAWSTPTFRL